MKRAHTSSACLEEETTDCKKSLKEETTDHKPSTEQKCLIDHVRQHIKSEKDEQLDILVEGTVGTGKATLLRLLQKAFIEFWGPSSVILTAFTGRAAYTIGGTTLHSAFGLPFIKDKDEVQYKALDRKRRENYSELYACARVLMIYDVYVMSSRVYEWVDRRLQEIKMQGKPFGGLHLIKFGDFHQVKPSDFNSVFKCELWKERTKYYPLREVVGPRANLESGRLLQRLAYGTLTTRDTFWLRRRENKYSRDGPRLCYSKFQVGKKHMDIISGRRCHAISKSVDKEPDKSTEDEEDDGYLEDKIILVKGLSYSLTHNLDVPGLVRGLIGKLKDITLVGEDRTKVQRVTIEFSENSGLCFNELFSAPIKRIVRICKIDEKLISRNQLPIRMAEAITIQSSLGFTYKTVTVLTTLWSRAHQYTAFSRVKNLGNLYLWGDYNQIPKFNKEEEEVLRELIRLRENARLAIL